MQSLTDVVAPGSCERSSISTLRRHLTGAMCLALLTACPPKDDGEQPGESETDSASASETDPSSADTTVGDEPSTSPTEATESGATEPGDTDGPELPDTCYGPAPGVSAAFSIEGDWLNDDKMLRPCTVEAVELEPGTIVTALTCDFEGGAGAVTIRAAAAFEGPPTWKAGDEVKLRSWFVEEADYWLIEMRRSVDDDLLLLALQGEVWHPEALAPLTMEASFPCGLELESGAGTPMTPFQLDFELGGFSQGLLEGQRGALTLPEAQAFVIDVEQANTNNCCHYTRWHKFLIRRVSTK